MNKNICLLRGVNVSGKNLIKMKDFKVLLESSGFHSVKTYIQSGNIVFETPENDKNKVSSDFSEIIKSNYGYSVSCLVLSPGEILQSLNDFPEELKTNRSPKKSYVMFLNNPVADEFIGEIPLEKYEPERFGVKKNVIYYSIPDNISPGKLGTNLFESKFKVTGTSRNINTLEKIIDLAK
ncbi:DUF1697 domain-containing protein [Marinigracilibium pacificum]|uniref:DUF1697 domain-containing protein n=1 Tax=Marinigracilibium pacificum TaxID=2729599 RepID=A0A848ISG4_9BACT|nr:DUF1697 domain-containing protein [Marinigracilibium pacificum]NMM47287.1 DUF1697 domain-containing protein [Marinigracilibium pacificum]